MSALLIINIDVTRGDNPDEKAEAKSPNVHAVRSPARPQFGQIKFVVRIS